MQEAVDAVASYTLCHAEAAIIQTPTGARWQNSTAAALTDDRATTAGDYK